MSGTAAIVLAAGASTRLGEPKQLIELGGERLLERAVRTAREAGLKRVVVVVGARAAEIISQCDLRDAEIVHCKAWAEGMSQSLAAGLAAVEQLGVRGAVVMTADMPFVTPSHLMALARKSGSARASSYAGRHGVPAYFPSAMFAALKKLTGDAGARDLLRQASAVALDEADALDVDTPEALAAVRARFAVEGRGKRGERR